MTDHRDPPSYFLEQAKVAEAAQNQELAQMWQQIHHYHHQNLWHQFTNLMLELVTRPELQTGNQLYELYANFRWMIIHQRQQPMLNSLSVVQIFRFVGKVWEKEEAIQFLENLGKIEAIKVDTEAFALTKVLQGEIQLDRKNIEKTKNLVEEIDGLINEIDRVGFVHGQYYKLASQLNIQEGSYADYYRASLHFLGCTELDSLAKEERIEKAFHLSLAALLGKDIFNFGELLAHPILDDLKGTKQEWIVKVLMAFNSGDVRKFSSMRSEWEIQQDLVANEVIMYEKICLLALMEMTFQRSATDRSLTFKDIAKQTGLEEDKVELLVMKALAKGLVKGSIDQVAQVVNLTWVQPRVLDKEQLKTLVKKINEFTTSIDFMENMIEKNASDILTK